MSITDIKDRAAGRWPSILMTLGIGHKHLNGKHGPCPMCGGHDRFRFDAAAGRFYCNQCGNGSGVDLVMAFKGVDFKEAMRLIEAEIGSAKIEAPKARRSNADQRSIMTALWAKARPLNGHDIASRYLTARGLPRQPPGSCVRWIDELAYTEGAVTTHYPGMLALFVAPDRSRAIIHRTFLSEPGVKAAVATPRKMMPGTVPEGGAVRLSSAGETMGIAEGIETALAANNAFRIPVWAATSAGALAKWQPPPEARHIIVFGDLDPNFKGQTFAYSLASRLKTMWADAAKTERYQVEVRFTQFYDNGQIKEDWNAA